MLSGRDALRITRTAPWHSDEEIQAFVAEVEPLVAADVGRWLSLLTDGTLLTDRRAHRKRLRTFALLSERAADPPSLFVPFVRALEKAGPELRELLVALLPRVNRVQGHEELCTVLGSADPEVRAAAARVLDRVGGKIAFDVLVDLVGRSSFDGRIEALDVMIRKAPQHGLLLIERVLAAGRTAEKLHALRMLESRELFPHDVGAVVQMAAGLLGESDGAVVEGALSVVAAQGTEDQFFELAAPLLSSPHMPVARAVVLALARRPSKRGFALLADTLAVGPVPLRVAVLETAEAIGQPSVVPLLVAGLGQEQPVVRARAVEAAERLIVGGHVDAAEVVVPLLGSRDVSLRRMAIELLSRVGDPTGQLGPRLLKHLRDEDWWVRERAMDALVQFAGPGLRRYLLPYLADPSAVVRRFALGALRRVQDATVLPVLVRLATADPDWWVREMAISAMGDLGELAAVPPLVGLLGERPDLHLVCIESLVKLGSSQAVSAIAPLVSDDDPDVRLAAIEALVALDAREQAHVVGACTEDDDLRVRSAARSIVGRWQLVDEPSTMRHFVGLDDLLPAVLDADADDLLLLAGRPPYLKRRGEVEELGHWGPLSDPLIRAMIAPHLSEVQRKMVEDGVDVDFSYEMPSAGARFRVNLFVQSTGVGAVFRVIKNDALLVMLDNLGLPPVVAELATLRDGLVLIGGPTGSGKSTTLAALVERINRTSPRHIVTIEDPIEAVHLGDRSLITQREVRSHTPSFEAALRASLRQDPDVIVVGEMRDPGTFQFAVSAAETGHLVLATLHAGSAEACVTRIIGAFPPAQQPLVRAMLASSLRGILCQALLRRKSGEGRVLAAEVMVNNDAVATLIRKGKTFQLPSLIVLSANQGMQLLDPELARLVREGVVEFDEAWRRANDKSTFEGLVSGKLQPEALVAAAGLEPVRS